MEYWFFEFLILGRRLCFSAVVSFPFASDHVTVFCVLLVLTFFLVIEVYTQPFLHQVNNNCEIMFQLFLMIIAYRFSRSTNGAANEG